MNGCNVGAMTDRHGWRVATLIVMFALFCSPHVVARLILGSRPVVVNFLTNHQNIKGNDKHTIRWARAKPALNLNTKDANYRRYWVVRHMIPGFAESGCDNESEYL